MSIPVTGETSIETVFLGSYIDGKRIEIGVEAFELRRPKDDALIGQMREAGVDGVQAAVAAALAAARVQARGALHARLALLEKAADALAAAADAVAALICEDVGKPIRIAKIEVKRGVELLRGCAAVAAHHAGETIPLDAAAAGTGCIGFVMRVPYGVVGAITPFNAPVNLLLQKVAPAVAAGNAVVAKPAPAGLRTALKLAELFFEAGWPAGLFNVVSGDRETAAALAAHPDVRAVSFTGGTAGGEALARLAGSKKFASELGSNAANIVFADADLAQAAKKIASAGFEASGQQCISAQRIIVQRSAFDAFATHLVEATGALKVGDAEDPTVDVGPMVSTAAADRVMAMYEDARQRGAKVLLEPRRSGAMVSPAILAGVPREARLWREEVFGPVVIVATFDTEDEALALANDSEFGLQGAIFTNHLQRAMRFAREFDVGSLWINEASRFRLDNYPFGGVKASGVGREGLRYAIEELSQLKFVGIRT